MIAFGTIRKIVIVVFGLMILGRFESEVANGQTKTNEISPNLTPATRSPTEKDVQDFLTNGVTKEAVRRTFGKPINEETLADKVMSEIYIWDTKLGSDDAYNVFEGIEVFYKDDRIIKWSPIYGNQEVGGAANVFERDLLADTTDQSSVSGTKNEVLNFYLVGDEEFPGSVFINTSKLPRLGYISTNAAISIRQIKRATEIIPKDKNAQENMPIRFAIQLIEQDAKAMESVTSTNVGTRLLLSIGHTPLIAPMIQVPITSGTIEVELLSVEEAQILRRELKRMPKFPTGAH